MGKTECRAVRACVRGHFHGNARKNAVYYEALRHPQHLMLIKTQSDAQFAWACRLGVQSGILAHSLNLLAISVFGVPLCVRKIAEARAHDVTAVRMHACHAVQITVY